MKVRVKETVVLQGHSLVAKLFIEKIEKKARRDLQKHP